MTTVFSENLKKFRLAKGYTQEQVAEKLGIVAQTVSRWECSTSLPDVLMLPEIAHLYEVTIDDLYKKNTIAYENYAQRLSAVYEKSRDPEDFMRCVAEYDKLMKQGPLSLEDQWNYAIVHHFMMRYCRDVAMEWYHRALSEDPNSDPHAYERIRSCRADFFFDIGRGAEFICEQEVTVSKHPSDPQEWLLLIEVYVNASRYEEGYAAFAKAVERFPDNWKLYIHGGNICRILKRYDEALIHLDKAGEIGTEFCDEKFCQARCYTELGDHEKAAALYTEIANIYRQRGYDVEADMAEQNAIDIRNKINA